MIKIFQAWEGCESPPYVGASARKPISARDQVSRACGLSTVSILARYIPAVCGFVSPLKPSDGPALCHLYRFRIRDSHGSHHCLELYQIQSKITLFVTDQKFRVGSHTNADLINDNALRKTNFYFIFKANNIGSLSPAH